MNTITIISTYPEFGSKNIGDALITNSLKQAISDLLGPHLTFNTIWRAAQWNKVKETIIKSDFIIFACLAIRENMGTNEYPFINEILNSSIPFGIMSSGTALNPYDTDILNTFPESTTHLLEKLNKKAVFFNTRGVLTQSFCENLNLNNVSFAGDIAFYDTRFDHREFQSLDSIKSIVISDPHYPSIFKNSYIRLIKTIRKEYPNASITTLFHGINPIIEQICKEERIPFIKIYEDIVNGLDKYDDYDMHIGFRVHAHVSMLKRRKPSYLIEQDGRGIDYGLTINNNISINSAPIPLVRFSLKKLYRFLPKGKEYLKVNSNNIDLLFAIIKQDKKTNFRRFTSIEKQINTFISNIKIDLKKITLSFKNSSI